MIKLIILIILIALSNKNLIKLNKKEIYFLQNISAELKYQKYASTNEQFINIEKDIFDKLNVFFTVNQLKTPLIIF